MDVPLSITARAPRAASANIRAFSDVVMSRYEIYLVFSNPVPGQGEQVGGCAVGLPGDPAGVPSVKSPQPQTRRLPRYLSEQGVPNSRSNTRADKISENRRTMWDRTAASRF